MPADWPGLKLKPRRGGLSPESIAREVAGLTLLEAKTLKQRWRALYGSQPPKAISRELLTRAIAYRLQERAFGGLKPSTRRLVERIGDGRSSSQVRLAAGRKSGAGTVLLREWHGASHRVTLLDDGVVYRGQRYRSLSEVARAITGARWSGPLFFGLKGRAKEAGIG
jgi:hypothetical protein